MSRLEEPERLLLVDALEEIASGVDHALTRSAVLTRPHIVAEAKRRVEVMRGLRSRILNADHVTLGGEAETRRLRDSILESLRCQFRTKVASVDLAICPGCGGRRDPAFPDAHDGHSMLLESDEVETFLIDLANNITQGLL